MNHSAEQTGSQPTRLARLQHAVEHAAHLLPAQGPITVFVHHNTLHAFEHLPFTEAVKKGAQIFGCQPYLSEERFRRELVRGRIRFSELKDVLAEDLGDTAQEPLAPGTTRLQLRLAMLQYPIRTGTTEELIWYIAEKDALRRIREEASSWVRESLIAETRHWVMRDLRGGNEGNGSAAPTQHEIADSLSGLLNRFSEAAIDGWTDADWAEFTPQVLWCVCCDGVANVPALAPPPSLPIRHRDLLLAATGEDADLPVHELLTPFCAAYLDQGFANWQLPERDRGFLATFCTLYRRGGGSPARWMQGLADELARLQDGHVSGLQLIEESLDKLGVSESDWDAFLAATLLALRGWGGMVQQIEVRGDRVAHPIAKGSLVDFVAVRLLLDRFALAHVAREALGFTGPLSGLRLELRKHLDKPHTPSVEQRAFMVFQLAQVMGWPPSALHRLSKPEWTALLEEIEAFSDIERRRIFHLAYERRFFTQTLDAIALHARRPSTTPTQPRFQVISCLDEREESFRRHLEEVSPDVETLGAAGFFNIPMYYRGAADAHFVPLCPIVITPRHWVTEAVDDHLEETHRRRAKTRRALGAASHHFHVGSRTFALGAILSAAVGVLASIPLVARILFPRSTARIRHLFGRFVQTPPMTRLQLERAEPTPGPVNGQIGLNPDEMADCGERLLRDTGLTTRFSRLVLLIGHGSNSLNNPHNSAYNCGACSGAAGGPNARAIAHVLNDPRIRAKLAERGLALPAETVFVGGYHNTCDDSVTFFDVEHIPESHREDFAAAHRNIQDACKRNAHERSRRFMSAPLNMSFNAAKEHVEERSEDLAQTRPECGHATNAISLVGRRDWSRGLYLDRRAFLTSYDPTKDDADNTILTRILSAIFPVCAGINLEYYFSYVDNTGFGCGTKLPHNLSALLGVMDGAASDLRTGLPWQMVEIHEPVRLTFVIETTPQAMQQIIDRNPGIGQLCRNGWILLAVLNPHTRRISYFDKGSFVDYDARTSVLPRTESSVDWYRGWRDHLEFAEIER